MQKKSLIKSYSEVRKTTELLCQSLSAEDQMVQSMADASPTKWHLAHTSWFFEKFVLKNFLKNYKEYKTDSDLLFNSYYLSLGIVTPRTQRGLISRPSLDEIFSYRSYINDKITSLIEDKLSSSIYEINSG